MFSDSCTLPTWTSFTYAVHAARKWFVVTNGDQTDTIVSALEKGDSAEAALASGVAARVRERLETAEAATMCLLEPHLDQLRRLAERLMIEEDIEGEALERLLITEPAAALS